MIEKAILAKANSLNISIVIVTSKNILPMAIT